MSDYKAMALAACGVTGWVLAVLITDAMAVTLVGLEPREHTTDRVLVMLVLITLMLTLMGRLQPAKKEAP